MIGRRPFLFLPGLVLAGGQALAENGDPMFPIPKTDAEAAERVAARYAITYAGLLMRMPLDDTVQEFPVLGAGDFRLVESGDEDWTFAYEPLSGPAIRARVSRLNGYVEFDSVVVSAE